MGGLENGMGPRGLEAQPASPWMPIPTAPKDGSSVLLYDPRLFDEKRIVGLWWEGRWLVDKGLELNPTHWMRLPEPPEVSK